MENITEEMSDLLEEHQRDGGVVEYNVDGNVITCVMHLGYGVIDDVEEAAESLGADFLDCLPQYVLEHDGSHGTDDLEHVLGLDGDKPYVIVLETRGFEDAGEEAWESLSQLFGEWDESSAVTWMRIDCAER